MTKRRILQLLCALPFVTLPAPGADAAPPKIALQSGKGLLSVSATTTQTSTLAVVPSAVPALRTWMAAFVAGKAKAALAELGQQSLGPTAIVAIRLPALSPTGPGGPILLDLHHGKATAAPKAIELSDADRKKFAARAFRLKIDGIPSAAHASTLGALVIGKPGSLEIPSLVLTVAESHAAAFHEWYEQFAADSDSGQEKEKSGSIEYLTADARPLLTVKLAALRPVSVTLLKPQPVAQTSKSKSKPKKPAERQARIVLRPKKLTVL